MPQDAPPNGSAQVPARDRVAGMQAKLHRWAAAGPGRRLDDLFNLVHDSATLFIAFCRVAGNKGANTPGVDGVTAEYVEKEVGVPGFLDDLRAALKDGSFRPLPVRERMIPKPGGSGKLRKLGIPAVADRVVQAALKLVLEPVFEADFEPVSYGFRPKRRAQDAIAEIHFYGTRGYHWVLDADIEAAFDNVPHPAVMERVRARVKDKRALALVKAFLKAGVLSELGEHRETLTGTPQGGILSPLIFNVALSALDEHLTAPWKESGAMSTDNRRTARRRKGLPNWRIVRYADDFAVMIHGSGHDAEALREEIAGVLAGLGLRLSQAKTRVVHMDEGFSFLGFRIQRRRKRGTSKWYVYTFIDDRPVRSLKAEIRALTHRKSQLDLGYVLTRLNQVMHGWAGYLRHAVAKNAFDMLDNFAWWRVIRMLMVRHRWRWKDVRRRLIGPSGAWRPIAAGGTALRPIAAIPVTRYRYRGTQIPNPWAAEPA
jgi:RNA-directed DNA polymerase